ncbi:MAG: response regulator transcription factor [Eubacterium sp.]|nr:response regulator transcription factor [Eubacterium sp.]
MYKIGILEDDIKMGGELKVFLDANGHEGIFIEPGEYAGLDEKELISILISKNIDLILLDIGLPGFDGIKICKSLRKMSHIPIIIITSDNSELTELMSIQSGADDFVPKPFNTRILLARMEGVLNRVYERERETLDKSSTVHLSDGNIFTFDRLKGKILSSSNEEINLSKNEIQIMAILIEKQGEIVSRDDIISYLWDNYSYVDDNTLTVNMTRIRSKLEELGIKDAIVTRRGMGYMLN